MRCHHGCREESKECCRLCCRDRGLSTGRSLVARRRAASHAALRRRARRISRRATREGSDEVDVILGRRGGIWGLHNSVHWEKQASRRCPGVSIGAEVSGVLRTRGATGWPTKKVVSYRSSPEQLQPHGWNHRWQGWSPFPKSNARPKYGITLTRFMCET